MEPLCDCLGLWEIERTTVFPPSIDYADKRMIWASNAVHARATRAVISQCKKYNFFQGLTQNRLESGFIHKVRSNFSAVKIHWLGGVWGCPLHCCLWLQQNQIFSLCAATCMRIEVDKGREQRGVPSDGAGGDIIISLF